MAKKNKNKSNSELIREINHEVQLAWRLLRDPRVPSYLKVGIPAVTALYVLVPFDFIPDFIPVLGQIDDIAAIVLGLRLFIQLAPKDVVAEHEAALSGKVKANKEEVVDADYRVK